MAPESLAGLPPPVLILWFMAAAGWTLVAVGLRRGLRGFVRRTALIAHFLTAPTSVLMWSFLGFGSLYATIALAAEWWALLLATRGRPERLVRRGTLPRLALWAALAALGTWMATRAVIPP